MMKTKTAGLVAEIHSVLHRHTRPAVMRELQSVDPELHALVTKYDDVRGEIIAYIGRRLEVKGAHK